MPHLNSIQKKFGKQGFTVIAVTSETADIVKRFSVHHTPIDYKVFVQANTQGYPGQGIPRAYLVDAEGKIAWQGRPSSLSDKKIEELLKARIKSVATKFSDAPRSAISNFLNGKHGSAYNAVKKSSKDGAKQLLAHLEQIAQKEMAFADNLFKNRDYLEAYNTYKNISITWKDTEFSKKAKKLMEECKSGEAKKEYKALQKLEFLTSKMPKKKSDLRRMAKTLESFSESKLYKDTKAGTKAKELAKVLANPWDNK